MTILAKEKKLSESDPYLDQFPVWESTRSARQEPAWMLERRRNALARYSTQGFPTLQSEDWRFTPIQKLTKWPIAAQHRSTSVGAGGMDKGSLPFEQIATDTLVFVDGEFSRELSNVGELPSGVFVEPISACLERGGAELESELGVLVTGEENAFSALNMAYYSDGGRIIVPRGVTLPRPIHICFVSTGKEPSAAGVVRNIIRVDTGASATVLESYVGSARSNYFINVTSEVDVGDDGFLEHLRFQDDKSDAQHMGTLHYRLGKQSRCWAHSLALGAAISRVNIRASLNGEGLEAIWNGLYLTRGNQLADHHMVVNHIRPHCASHEYFNGILDDRSKAVFHGRILVQKEAQKTDAKQTNKNLLLSDDATVDTKPQLEIYADDVKCTHGATVGQLNEDSIFYLRARGIGKERARRMLMHAFAGEIIGRIQNEELRTFLDRIVWDRLELNPHVAAGEV